jgi:hypothetical protein
VKIHFSKITNLVSVFLLIFISFSCISTKPLLIEIPQKSNKELPENIQSLLLIARVVTTGTPIWIPTRCKGFFTNKVLATTQLLTIFKPLTPP